MENFEIENDFHNLVCPWCGNDRLTVTLHGDVFIKHRVTCPRCQHFVYLNKDNSMREWANYCLDVILLNSSKYPSNMAIELNKEVKNPINIINIMNKYKNVLEANAVNEKENDDNKEVDMVNHPSHYETGKYECIEVMVEALGADVVMHFCLGNAFKYLYRCRRKNGVEDIKKARWYLNKYLELWEDFGNEDN